MQACIHGNTPAARIFLKYDAFVDYQDDDLWTAAHFASARSYTDVLHLLFEVESKCARGMYYLLLDSTMLIQLY